MDHDALLPSQPTAPTTTNATPRAHSTPRRVSAVLGDKSNLPRALQNERLVPSPSPRTRSVGGEGREQQHFAVAVPPRRAATAGGRASGTGGRASRAGEERINVFRDSGEEGRTARAAGMERGIIRTNSINLTTLSSALPTVEPTPATPTARSASPSGTATPLQAPLPTSPILVSRISQSLNNTQPQLELEERPTFSAFPQGRGTLYDGLGAYSMDEEELAQIYHPPAPNSGSTIPFVEGNSSMVIEDEDETEADMDLTVVVGGDVVEPAGGSGVVERENEGRGGEPIAGREGTVTSEGEIPVERRRSSLSKKLAGPTRPPTLATKRKTKKAANASPPSTHPTRRSTTQLSDSSFSDHDPLAPIDSSDTESSDIDQFRLPPRLREPRVDATLPTGPPSSEDDLAYAIRTSSTGEWDRDWDEMRELEGEVGEGFEAGARIGKWGEGTGRRERFLGLRRQVVGWEERLRVESGGSEDELLIK
ncbi:hypothetical protein MNV49_000860 [Pseudohyphozyma bogoriensis]|nr:hypothetical protein MNV49_000860 [Pseudohyphozyma bogoriensis]